MEAGNVPFQYKKMLGYRKGADGAPEIVPEEAEIVRRIYDRYLAGCSLSQIKQDLDADLQEAGETAWELARLAQSGREGDGVSMLTLLKRLTALTAEQELLLEKVLKDMDNPDLNAQLKALATEKQGLLAQIEALRQRKQYEANQQSHMDEMRDKLREYATGFSDYDDAITRRAIEKITVLDAETVRIKFRNVDVEREKTL